VKQAFLDYVHVTSDELFHRDPKFRGAQQGGMLGPVDEQIHIARWSCFAPSN
jgi:hypothetical protein